MKRNKSLNNSGGNGSAKRATTSPRKARPRANRPFESEMASTTSGESSERPDLRISPPNGLKDDEVFCDYGSEADSDSDNDDDDAMSVSFIPRVVRPFLGDRQDSTAEVPAKINLQWPPKIATKSMVVADYQLEIEYVNPKTEIVKAENEKDAVSENKTYVDYENKTYVKVKTETYEWPDIEPEIEISVDPEYKIEIPNPTPKILNLKTETFGPAASKTVFGPNKFDFEWKPFPQPQTEPELRRETFSEGNCGPTTHVRNPYEAFTAIWDTKIMEHIVKETNRYANQLIERLTAQKALRPTSRITRWKNTDIEELYVYFAVVLATGITVKTRLEEYWNSERDIFMTPGFGTAMSFNRFALINRCIHFNNNDNCDPNMTQSEAKLFKIQPIVSHLNNKFCSLYVLNRNIYLDESFTMWKGWLDMNQSTNTKVASVGIKTYEVCDTVTGYMWRFEMHARHDNLYDESNPNSATIPTFVLRLLNGLENKGYTIWIDNFNQSPALARELKLRGFDCVGTIRRNCQLLPVEMRNLKKSDIAIGETFGCTSGDVDIILWRDKNNLVSLISTYHGLATVKCGDTSKPNIVPDYNACVNGLDMKDRIIAMYPIERKRTRIWYKKMFRRLLNVSVLNAYTLLKSQPSESKPITSISHRDFRITLVNELLEKHSKPTAFSSNGSLNHFPEQFKFLPGDHERLRRVCVECKRRTSVFCKGCDPPVPLCVFTCFEPYHNKLKKPKNSAS